ncbi:MAG: ROK family protein [Parcubacteria group bacterium]|nr:ROK family protein [Parcubacteria group bacterium]
MIILFDIGGTKMRLSCSHNGTTLDDVRIVPRPEMFDDAMELFIATAKEFAGGESIERVAGGIAGIVDSEKGVIIDAPNISADWIGKPFSDTLSQALGAPVFVANDAAIVGLGEAVVGAGKGNDIVAYITVSTGVGGARIVSGDIDEHALGFEPGHQIIDADATIYENLEKPYDLEDMVSGSGVEKRFGKKPYEIPQTDPLWDELAYYLAIGLHNINLQWSPDVFVLGGMMMIGDPKIPLVSVEREFAKLRDVMPSLPPLILATLGDIGGLHGALAYARKKTINDPKRAPH